MPGGHVRGQDVAKLPGEVRLDLAGMVVTNLRQLVATARTEPPWTPLRLHLAADQSTHAVFYLAAEEAV
jgi:hypothetical protein